MAKNETTAHDIGFSEATDEQINNFNMDAHLVNLLLHEPFFSTFIRNMTKVKSYAVPTAGVAVDDLNVMFYWNPRFLAGLNASEVKELLKHECYHVIFKHCTSRKQDPPMVWNIATDLAINSILDHKNLPEGGLVPGKPLKTDNIKDPKTKERWLKLSEFIENAPLGKSSEWYMEKMKNDEDLMEAVKKCCDDMTGQGEGIPILMDDHEGWGGMSDEEREITKGKIRQAVEEAVKECDKKGQWGSISSETRGKIREAISKEIPWEMILKQFVGMSRRAKRSTSRMRLNKKYPGIHSGHKRGYTSSIAVYIDQSGSVSNDELALLFGELRNLAKNTEFVTYHFDTEVDESSEKVWRSGKTPETHRTRCGGTCFKAPTIHANKNKHRFDGYLILTDGYAPNPGHSRLKRGWVVTTDGTIADFMDRETEKVETQGKGQSK